MTWLDDARARCEAATPRWMASGDTEEGIDGGPDPFWARKVGTICRPEDRAFAIAARTDLPRALALIEEMAAALEAALDGGDWHSETCPVEQIRAALARLEDPVDP